MSECFHTASARNGHMALTIRRLKAAYRRVMLWAPHNGTRECQEITFRTFQDVAGLSSIASQRTVLASEMTPRQNAGAQKHATRPSASQPGHRIRRDDYSRVAYACRDCRAIGCFREFVGRRQPFSQAAAGVGDVALGAC